MSHDFKRELHELALLRTEVRLWALRLEHPLYSRARDPGYQPITGHLTAASSLQKVRCTVPLETTAILCILTATL